MSKSMDAHGFVDGSRCFDVNLLKVYTQRQCRQKEDVWTKIVDPHHTRTLVQSLMKQCCSPTKNIHHRSKYSTLYCGDLGPECFLRLHWAKKLSSSVDPSHPSTPTERQLALEQAKFAAEAALLQCPPISLSSSSSSSSSFRVTLQEGKWVGAMCLLTAIEQHLGHIAKAKQHTTKLLEVLKRRCSELPPPECEVLYGRAGAIQAILFLRSELQQPELGQDFVVQTAVNILKQGMKNAHESSSRLPLLWQWHGKSYLGAAHGVVGILHTLLHLTPSEWKQVEKYIGGIDTCQLIQDCIQSLIEGYTMESGNLQSSIGNSEDRLVHWCHGAPGLCLLLIRASKVYQDQVTESYLSHASDIAERVVWPRGLLRKGVGLCHGISGNGYVFLQLADAFCNDQLVSQKWKQRAHLYACFALDHLSDIEEIPDRPKSLYEGTSGFLCFLLDCSTKQPALFPLYDFF